MCVPLPGRFFTAFGRTRGVSGQMHQSAFLRHCRLLSVAALGAMLAFPASAQTGPESQTPSTGSPGSESQTPSTGSPGSESQTPSTGSPGSEFQTPSTATPGTETQSESPGTPTGSNSAVPEANPASTTIQPRKAAVPDILIAINKPTQRMTVTVNGHVRYRWRVSTGATKYSTPPGSYKAFRMERMHYSASGTMPGCRIRFSLVRAATPFTARTIPASARRRLMAACGSRSAMLPPCSRSSPRAV